MRSAKWKTYFKSTRAILQTIDQCAKEVKKIQTAMLVSVFVSNIPCFRIKKLSQLIIEEERQRKLTEGIKDSQEVLGAVVLRMSPVLLWAFLKESKFLGRAYRHSESDFQESYKYVSSQNPKQSLLTFSEQCVGCSWLAAPQSCRRGLSYPDAVSVFPSFIGSLKSCFLYIFISSAIWFSSNV
jgi:hypothetical protein